MSIERTRPLAIHKNLVIRALDSNPDDVTSIFPAGTFSSAAEAIKHLEDSAAEWFVGDEFLTDAEFRAKYPI